MISDSAYEMVGIPKFESLEDIYRSSESKVLADRILSLTDDAFIPLPIDWQEENRYMPSTITENYGKFDRSLVPYLVEPLNRLHPDDPTTHIAIMKSVQSACTTTVAEGGMGFFTRYKLGSSAYFTATKTNGKMKSSNALDVLIDNAGLAGLIKPISNRTKRKSADTSMYKEFSGGVRWLISSYNSISDMKSATYNLLVCDEWDEAGVELKGQGDIGAIIEGRTMATRLYKMLFMSTPSMMDSSRIYKEFLKGDQRRFFVPCPICGEHQILELKSAKMDYGLTFSMMKNKETGHKELDVNSVRYICKHCHREFYESSKKEMLMKGEWIPTWKDSDYAPKSKNHKSYHISGLISNMLPWARFCQQFINTKFGRDLMLFKDFTINYKGEPWANVEQSADWKKFADRAEDYTMGEVPHGALRLYAGCDVQGDRLELAVVGVGEDMEKWLVDYQVFYGDPSRINDKSWISLHNYVYTKRFNIMGVESQISLCAVDTGFDPRQKREKDWDSKGHLVYDFVGGRQDKFIAIRGVAETKGFDIIKPARVSHGLVKKRYDISTHIIKEMFMNVINETAGPGAIHFPKWRIVQGAKIYVGDELFRQFLSERYQEISPKKMGWKKINERNEVWDTFIYATACMYLENIQGWDSDVWEAYRQELKNLGSK